MKATLFVLVLFIGAAIMSVADTILGINLSNVGVIPRILHTVYHLFWGGALAAILIVARD